MLQEKFELAKKFFIGWKSHRIMSYSFVKSILYRMYIIFKTNPYKLPTRSPNNPNRRGYFPRIKMFPIYTSLNQSLNLNSFRKHSILIFKIQRSKHFSLALNKEEYLIKHITFINDYLFLCEF